MINKKEKGRRKELLCLKELEQFYKDKGSQVVKTWHTHTSRAGGNDFLDSWDIALLIHDKYTDYQVGVQVKSQFRWAEFARLNKMWVGVYGDFFLAIYNKQKEKEAGANIILPNFQLFSVTGNSPLFYELERRQNKKEDRKVRAYLNLKR